MPTEVEARFRATGPVVLADLARRAVLGGATLGPARTVDETDRYLDTAGGAFAAARWACRLRARGGGVIVSLKGPLMEAPPDAWLHRRPEVEGAAIDDPDPASWPASEARALVDRLRAGASLVERFVLRQRRTERAVTLDGDAIGTLSLDAVDVEHGGQNIGCLDVVELELGREREAEAALRTLAAALAGFDGLSPEPRSKLQLALELIGAR